MKFQVGDLVRLNEFGKSVFYENIKHGSTPFIDMIEGKRVTKVFDGDADVVYCGEYNTDWWNVGWIELVADCDVIE